MAKNTTTVAATDSVPAITYIETTEAMIRLPWSGETVSVDRIPPTSIAYLLQYGANKTGQDAASGLLSKATEAHKALTEGKASEAQVKALAKWAREIGRNPDSIASMDGADFAKMVAIQASADRWADVMDGKMDIPGTVNRLTGLARIIRDLTEEMLKARAKARGQKLPVERLKGLVDQALAQTDHPEMVRIREMAERRMAEEESLRATAGDVLGDDLDSLLSA